MTDYERNEPCWCGSGKKYKKCHYLTESMPTSIEEAPFWIQMRVAEGELQEELHRFYKAGWEDDLVPRAQRAFIGRDSKDLPEEVEINNVIVYWAMSPFCPGGGEESLAFLYLKAKNDQLSDIKKRVLRALDERLFSFYQIREVDPGVCMKIRDLLLGDEWTVMERAGSDPNTMGRIIYARVVSLDDQAIMMGCGPYPFDPMFIADVQNLRKFIKPKGQIKITDLYEHEETIQDVYLQLRDLHLHPKPPKITNTDGDPMEPVTLYWELKASLETAFDALLPLTLDTKEEALKSAKRDKNWALKWVELVWVKKGNKLNKTWDNTMLGRLVLEPGKMMAEVNSRKRAAKLRKEVEKRLGESVLFQKEVIENPAAKMKASTSKPSKPKDPAAEAEIKELTATFMKRQWEGWIDESIPALGGLTPKQAVKTKEGKELVEALLFSFEAGNGRTRSPQVDVDDLRRRLKLKA